MNTSYRLGLYEKSMPGSLYLREKLIETKKAGFDYMELSIDETNEKLARLDWNEGQIITLRRDMEETDVQIHSICLSGHRKYPLGHPEPATRQCSMEIMEKAIHLAYRLGIRLIQLAGYDVYYEEETKETRAFFEENLKKSVKIAAEYGVMLAFETMETPFMNTVEKSMKYVKMVDNAWLQVYPDIGNLTNAAVTEGHSVTDDLEIGRGHIVAVHLKETVPGIFREVPFGTGHVNFITCVKKALELGVRTFVGEFWYTGNPEWKKDLIEANAFLRKKIQMAEEMD